MLKQLVSWMEKRGCFRMIKRKNRDTGEIEPYLYRGYILRTRWLGIYIHQFWSSDPDHPHSHPWANITYILKGGYHEAGADGIIHWRDKGFIRFRQAELFHRLLIGPHSAGSTWSLFIRFKRKYEWGFLSPEGWMEARKYGEKYGAHVDSEGIDFEVVGKVFPTIRNLRTLE